MARHRAHFFNPAVQFNTTVIEHGPEVTASCVHQETRAVPAGDVACAEQADPRMHIGLEEPPGNGQMALRPRRPEPP